MRRELSILAASTALAVSGIGINWARADDPAQPPASPPADNARADNTRGGMAAHQQSPAAKDVRETISQATSAAVQGKFEDLAKRFTAEDRKRLGDAFKDNQALRDRWTQFSNDWKAKYNQDFDSGHIDKALADASVRIFQGDLTDRARMAGERMSPENTPGNENPPKVNTPSDKDNTGDNNAGENNSGDHATKVGDKDCATIWIAGNDAGAMPSRVVLRKEAGIGNTWKIDLPDTFDAQALSDSLQQHVLMVEDQKGSWPADVNEAYRTVTQHVLMALSSAGAGAHQPGATPEMPNPNPNR